MRQWAKLFFTFGVVFVSIYAAALCVVAPKSAQAQSGRSMTIIRDSEIEASLHEWMQPLLKAANMRDGDVRIILVGSDQVNAFVAGGRNIFLYTGLILEAETPQEVIGVLAHELGHIEGGHLVRMRRELEQASYQSILANILGVGVAVLGGSAEAGAAISSGGNSVAGQNFLKHTRTQESSADQAAIKYFDHARWSPEGLVSFMRKLEGQELISSHYQSEYMRTHPVTRDRVDAMQRGLDRSPNKGAKMPAHWGGQFDRMKAKIQSYLDPSRAAQIYSAQRNEPLGQYALTIVDYRQGKMGKALDKLDGLLASEPKNPYLHELKGQILLEDRQIDRSIASYRTALKYAPEADFMRLDLAQGLIEKAGRVKLLKDQKSLLREAKNQLQRAMARERQTSRLHRLLATIYGRLGNNALAQAHLAEEAILSGKMDDARMFAQRAENALKSGDSSKDKEHRGAWLKVQDILQYLDNKKDTK